MSRENFMQKYLRFTAENEAPELYHTWSALTMLGHIFGRRVFMDRGHTKIYPGQIFTFLVGPPANRKSTAVNIAAGLLRQVPSVHFIAGKLSAQSLYDEMEMGMVDNGKGKMTQADSVVYISASELSAFLPKQNYVEELIPTLTKFIDAEEGLHEYKTRSHGSTIVKNPLVTMLGASTPDWLYKNIPENAWGGGFMSRVFLVYQRGTDRIFPNPRRTPIQDRLEKELVAELFLFSELKGPAILTKEAEQWYIDWYIKSRKNPAVFGSGQMSGYLGRRPDHLLRISMVLSGTARKTIITKRVLILADSLLGDFEKYLPELLGQKTTSAMGEQHQCIVDYLKGKTYATRTDILRRVWRIGVNAQMLDVYLETLLQAGEIETVTLSGKEYYRCVDLLPQKP